MNIKVLGPGCAKCEQLVEMVKETVAAKGKDAQVEKLTQMNDFIRYGVMSTPALVVDEKLVVMGRLPTKAELDKLLEQAG